MPTHHIFRTIVFLIVSAGVRPALLAAAPPQIPSVSPESPAFREFTQRVQQYVKLRQPVPRLRPTKQSKEIVERRNALAQKIREARSNARPGDIFTPEVAEEFGRVLKTAFRGPTAPTVRKTIRQGEPVSGWQLTVNGEYPDHLPLTTVPPTLLLHLPQLPAEVAYRIIGHDFVLEDTQARLIVDFIPGIVP